MIPDARVLRMGFIPKEIEHCDADVNQIIGEALEQHGSEPVELELSEEETNHYNGSVVRDGEIKPIKWVDRGFNTVDRQHIYFNENLEDLYRG
jgi:hypothetical protein